MAIQKKGMKFEGFFRFFVTNQFLVVKMKNMVRKLPKRAILEHLRKICVFDHMGARIFTTPWHK